MKSLEQLKKLEKETRASKQVECFDFDLTSPCADCPFLKTTPLHEGIAKGLPHLVMEIERGANIAHSCHKTDPRSDGFVKDYKGKVKHCAGLLVMLEDAKDPTRSMVVAQYLKKYDPSKLDRSKPTFKNFVEMVKHYTPMWKKIIPDIENRLSTTTKSS